MNSYDSAREAGATRSQAARAELRNLASMLDGELKGRDQLMVRARLVALSERISGPTEEHFREKDAACMDEVARLIRSSLLASRRANDHEGLQTALGLPEKRKRVCRASRFQL
ncbi:hypothetical protein CMI37_19035 [Candidatus Pacearchaeota archaeon]|nr:hypothetical protein [Candidatus Pacearchaeota archaeon]